MRQLLVFPLLAAIAACGAPSADVGSDAGAEDGGAVDGGAEADGDAGSGPGDGGAPRCEPFGRYGAPELTFTLPGPASSGGMYLPDLQARFPEVDWKRLDRLYIPAGEYTLINLGNLPERSPERPLVITNLGGQVLIRPPDGSKQGYIWAVTGGSNWVLTGRYDPESKTGDEAFPGHRCGAYATSRGRYGFLSDGAFVSGGHMGLGISGARQFELEFLELTRAGFAGLRVNQPNVNGEVAPLDGVRLHDLYIHDTKSEGIYFGSTQAPPTPLATGLKIFNNRILRSGTENLQVQNLGEGTEIHHNVFAWGAIDWRAAFQQYQDNSSQVQVRSGSIRIHHNAFIGGASNLLNFFSGPESGDGGRQVELSDNYFADTLNLGIYSGGTSGADSSYLWLRNAFRGLDFGYDSLNPSATDPGVVFRFGAVFDSPVTLRENRWEGGRRLVAGLDGGSGKAGEITGEGNVNGAVERFAFVQSGIPGELPTRALELWTDVATRAPTPAEVRYEKGALVLHGGELYECLAANQNRPPPDHPGLWRRLPLPADDVRTSPGTHWAERGVGLLDRP